MRDWISDLLLFCAGITGGILIADIKPYLHAAKRKRTELVTARVRMLAGIKEKHDEEILDEAFRTTEAIRGELDKSLQTLRKTLTTVLDPVSTESSTAAAPSVPRSNPAERNRSTS
ncbi:MAG TPA: hypothetical protein VH985_08210 [Candidatus Binatia bacterium]|jgi:hypothetical protein